jgi:hypothetical protein
MRGHARRKQGDPECGADAAAEEGGGGGGESKLTS